ncbi:MAG: hypothetical protein HYZ42_11980, partial [Bacteroidetes bacterium]|nr:hypothetical protein [Bacteroidota bacterium]
MKKIIVLIQLCFCTWVIQAQNNICTLKGESDGKQVKLLWLMSHWQEDFKGFEVKRRASNGAWENLTTTYIKPEMYENKDLSNVIKDPAELKRVTSKQQELIQSGKNYNVKTEEYIDKLSKDSGSFMGLLLTFTNDYDLALMNGFGFIDFDIPKGDVWEYGVFLVSTKSDNNAKLLQSFKWKYGTSTLQEVKVDVKARPNNLKTALNIKWSFDGKELQQKGYNGFNLYRKNDNSTLEKLNNGTIWKNGKGLMSHSFLVEKVDLSNKQRYIIKCISAFGTESKGHEIIYDPNLYFGNIEPPAILQDQIKMEVNYMQLEWKFDSQNQKYIKGFIVQRRPSIDSAFVNISSLIPANINVFKDSVRLKYDTYYFYRVIAKTIDDETLSKLLADCAIANN